MPESELKTTLKQRIFIFIIALLMLFSTIAAYIILIMNNKNSIDKNQKIAELQTKLSEKQSEVATQAKELSNRHLETLKSYRSEVRAYNANTANSGGIIKRDLKAGDGQEITEGFTSYLSYYIGFCADESIFDSSFDSYDKPTQLTRPLPAEGLITGWNRGVIGMKLGGVREITIPSEYAYKESKICGAPHSPLKFIILAIPEDKKYAELKKQQTALEIQLQNLRLGITR